MENIQTEFRNIQINIRDERTSTNKNNFIHLFFEEPYFESESENTRLIIPTVFGSQEAGVKWIKTPNAALGGRWNEQGVPALYLSSSLTLAMLEILGKRKFNLRIRSIWYMQGYLKTSGIVDIGYKYCKENHLFKDDYIYISYKEKLKKEIGSWIIILKKFQKEQKNVTSLVIGKV